MWHKCDIDLTQIVLRQVGEAGLGPCLFPSSHPSIMIMEAACDGGFDQDFGGSGLAAEEVHVRVLEVREEAQVHPHRLGLRVQRRESQGPAGFPQPLLMCRSELRHIRNGCGKRPEPASGERRNGV
mgnify:CR=1 FL=1